MHSKKETLAHIFAQPTPLVSVFLDNGATQRLIEDITFADIATLYTLFPPMLDRASAFVPYRGDAPIGTLPRIPTPSGELLEISFSSKERSRLFNSSLLTGPKLAIDRATCLGFLAWMSFIHGSSGSDGYVYAVHSEEETLGWITFHPEEVAPYVEALKTRFAFDIQVYQARFDGTSVEMSTVSFGGTERPDTH